MREAGKYTPPGLSLSIYALVKHMHKDLFSQACPPKQRVAGGTATLVHSPCGMRGRNSNASNAMPNGAVPCARCQPVPAALSRKAAWDRKTAIRRLLSR
jgi:hypothetical protein